MAAIIPKIAVTIINSTSEKLLFVISGIFTILSTEAAHLRPNSSAFYISTYINGHLNGLQFTGGIFIQYIGLIYRFFNKKYENYETKTVSQRLIG